MQVVETRPNPTAGVLPGSDFADAFRIDGLSAGANAETLARQAFTNMPRWITALMDLRNLVVLPLGLVRRNPDQASQARGFGFPVLSSRPDQVVMGLNDRHLDFRLVIEMSPSRDRQLSATATTYVRTHNLLGRVYLTFVKPFHRVIVPAMLRAAAR